MKKLIHLIWLSVPFLTAFFLWSASALDLLDQAQIMLEEGRTREAIDMLEKMLNVEEPEELARVVETLYNLYLQEGEDKKAVEVLKMYIEKFPEAYQSYLFLYWIAKTEEESHNFDQALSLLKEIALNFPKGLPDPYRIREQAWEDFAYILHHVQKRYQEALGVYQNILLHFPENERKLAIMNEMANCYEKLGARERALAIYQEILCQATDPFYRKLATLKIKYLNSEPNWSRKTLTLLYKEIEAAFLSGNVSSLEKLARKGDFWVGQIFSEFEVMEFESLKPYFEEKLKVAKNIEIEKPASTNGFYTMQISNWPDSEYNILYLLIAQENYGWEWKGIILSNQELEKEAPQWWSGINFYF
ncbi:MAG: hypothetical protein PWP60_80 [Candidatus Atribacteria bacterium]|nr:hypothetical protein [Candidatus Atribacteria bacterium]MDI3530231.1 hypothetical protein [Candidatus Atribacteria bacterium]